MQQHDLERSGDYHWEFVNKSDFSWELALSYYKNGSWYEKRHSIAPGKSLFVPDLDRPELFFVAYRRYRRKGKKRIKYVSSKGTELSSDDILEIEDSTRNKVRYYTEAKELGKHSLEQTIINNDGTIKR